MLSQSTNISTKKESKTKPVLYTELEGGQTDWSVEIIKNSVRTVHRTAVVWYLSNTYPTMSLLTVPLIPRTTAAIST